MDADESELCHGHVLEEFKEIKEVRGLIDNLKDIYKDLIAREASCERFTVIVDQYQEQPHLIDPYLESLMDQIITLVRQSSEEPLLMQEAFKYLYLITKMRGSKIVVRHFPHEVADVEPVLALLAKQDPTDHTMWETRYMLLLWLSMACMIPFDMSRLDSNIASATGERKKPAMDRILEFAQTYLTVYDKSQQAAAYLSSKFCTRPDVKQRKLPEFLDWALQILHSSDVETMIGCSKVTGILTMLALLFKHGKREDLLQYASMVKKVVEKLNISEINNTVLRKAGMKVTQRLGLTFLKDRVASWRYQRGSRSLSDNIRDGFVEKNKMTMKNNNATMEEDEEYDVPDDVEDVIEQLLCGLKDKDTIVRWSAAKGLGRITGRLPKELADDVVGSVLELFTLQETDGAWHGGCLTLAELGRRGLLLPQRLPDVVPVVLKALGYDQIRGNFSVGAHVRDAACYVCWAFARAYEPEDVTPYVTDIANALVKVSIFDREVNVRRAAAAAFQENVGRQGTFPHGIDILTTADYFAVGNRSSCYLDLSVFVANFPEYTQAMIDHLADVKVKHWDSDMRELTAKGLHNLTPKAPEYVASTVLPKLIKLATNIDLSWRHGAILAVAEITYALAKVAHEQNKKVTDLIKECYCEEMKNIVKELHKSKSFRGLGGEMMRKAVSVFIEKLSLSKMPYHGDPIIELWQEIIDDCLHHIEPEIQVAAAAAIPAFFREYYMDSFGKPKDNMQENIVDRYLKELQGTMETTSMGFSLAIGALPKFMICGKLEQILKDLIIASSVTPNHEKWAEGRKEALKALTRVCMAVGVQSSGSKSVIVCNDNVQQIYDAYFTAMRDYTLDSRGDAGAWVREASMMGLQELTSLIAKEAPGLITKDICKNLFCSIVQQSCEKIDRTRSCAGKIFSDLLYHKPEIPYIPQKEELIKVFPLSEIEEINWAAPSDTFRRFTKLLKLDTYMYSVLIGLTVSVGGLTESLVIHSSTSLEYYLRDISKDSEKMAQFADVLLKIFKDYQKDDRVSQPMLKTLDQLLSKGCFHVFWSDDSVQFPLEAIELVKKEISKSGDPNKLMSAADVFCGLLQFSGPTRKKCLQQLSIMLCHRYPRIRKATANKLYEALVTYDDVIPEEKFDDVFTVLSETNWDDDVATVRPIRNDLCDLMEVPKPVMLKPVCFGSFQSHWTIFTYCDLSLFMDFHDISLINENYNLEGPKDAKIIASYLIDANKSFEKKQSTDLSH
ncbi:hypothetical protein FSP39_007355 [Pinctada imbricata]|uniref:Tubulin-specific chaperone D n=1 Tax=Pinctada imbricata TaxID=66713 RepID=A0AA88XQD4_PINIB|nr:hypothetical protein FSP39_007355 [Pinctada imbricata]